MDQIGCHLVGCGLSSSQLSNVWFPIFSRVLALQRTLSIWWDAARELFEVDIEGGEAFEAGFDVAAARSFDANLMALDIFGAGSQTLLAITRRQRQRVDHGVRGGANLVDRDLRIFPP